MNSGSQEKIEIENINQFLKKKDGKLKCQINKYFHLSQLKLLMLQ